MTRKVQLPLLLLLAIGAARGQDWSCQSVSCEGQSAGYAWGMNHEATRSDCDAAGKTNNSPFFVEGCNAALVAKAWIAREKLVPDFPVEDLGRRFAKDNRLLPTDCHVLNKALENLLEGSSRAEDFFQTGCVEQAKKQAQSVIKDGEKRVAKANKVAAQEAEKQRQTSE